MNGSLRITGAVLICLALFTAPGCDTDDDWGMVGTVGYSDLGCWTIGVESTLGPYDLKYFEPINLPDRFKVQNLGVRFDHVTVDEWVTTCWVGDVIEITRIEEL